MRSYKRLKVTFNWWSETLNTLMTLRQLTRQNSERMRVNFSFGNEVYPSIFSIYYYMLVNF